MTVPDTERLHFMQDMQAALSHTPKSISPKYFYDQAGSALFDRICELPEYYPTRTELSILQTHAADMARHMGEHADIIEFGAGSLQKIRLLLNAATQPARFVPMDISGPHLQTASALLKKEFPALHIQPMVGDYTSDWQLPAPLPGAGKRVAFFPGSTIGNFSPAQAHTFFQNCAQHLAGGALLLGVDLIKSPDVLHAAYNDAQGVTLAIIAPDGRDGMFQHARECFEAGIPFLFDPGQGLPMFSGAELEHFIELATYVAVNDYEAELLTERTGLSLEQIAQRVSALIVTRGELGAEIFTKEKKFDIPCVKVDQAVDPTGCGDAFRAGVLYGLTNGMDWSTTGRLASLLGSIKISHQGGQNHIVTRAEIDARFHQAFGYAL